MRVTSVIRPGLFLFATLALTGCTGAFNAQNADPLKTVTTSSLKGIHGIVHGGRQAIAGAHIYVYAAGVGGVAGSNGSAISQSLLTPAAGGPDTLGRDANGNYYVSTNGAGNFALTGDYSCTAGQQVYLYATGGNPGDGDNPWSTLMAVLGTCPGTPGVQFASIFPSVVINEVSTVAAGYALAGYAANPLAVSSNNTTLAAQGVANAFATAASLFDITQGMALTTTPNGNGTVPQAEIDTLANALAACINSSGNARATTSPVAAATYSSNCTTLFSAATTVSGTHATDTADAIVNLAHYPGNQTNVAAIYGLPGSFSPFLPNLTSSTPPNDFTIAIYYTGGGADSGVYAMAVDAAGQIWTANGANNTLSTFSPLGVPISSDPGYTDYGVNSSYQPSIGLNIPSSIAIDNNGFVFVGNSSGNSISEFNSNSIFTSNINGVPFSGSPYMPTDPANPSYNVPNNPIGIAIDGGNAVWVTAFGSEDISLINNSLSQVQAASYFSYGSLSYSIAIDPFDGSAWVATVYSDCIGHVHIASTVPFQTLATTTFCGAGNNPTPINGSKSIALDHSGTKWATSGGYNMVARLNAAGVTSYITGGGLSAPYAVALDGNGNVWVVNYSGNDVSVFSNAGVAISPDSSSALGGGYQSTYQSLAVINAPRDLVIDGSGNVWTASSAYPGLTEFVGAAYPVVTPLAAAVLNNALGMQP